MSKNQCSISDKCLQMSHVRHFENTMKVRELFHLNFGDQLVGGFLFPILEIKMVPPHRHFPNVKCNYIQMQKVLINFMKNIEIQNKIYESFSKNILKNMSYLNSTSTNFTSNSGKMVINLINNYEK